MDLYRATFAGSLLLNALAFYQSHRSRKAAVVEIVTTDKKEEHSHVEPDMEGLSKLKKRFFPIYLLVNAADWLQGPYIYPIYKGASTSIMTANHGMLTRKQTRKDFRKNWSHFYSLLASSPQVSPHPLQAGSQTAMAERRRVWDTAYSTRYHAPLSLPTTSTSSSWAASLAAYAELSYGAYLKAG